MRFTKMHAYGNAYVYVDCRRESVDEPGRTAPLVSDARTGVGSDGLFLIFPSTVADARAEMYNADGSRMSMCGNGIRCTARFVLEGDWNAGRILYPDRPVDALSRQVAYEGHEDAPAMLRSVLARTLATLAESGVEKLSIHALTIETDAGVRKLYCHVSSGRVVMVTADVSPASLKLADMNCTLDGETAIDRSVSIAGKEYSLTCVSTGNLHAVVFVNDVDGVQLAAEGQAIECASIFPDRANVHFAQVLSPTHLRTRTWERGSGATRACGTGACASVVAAQATRRASGSCIVDQPGGRQLVDVGETVYLTGEARTVCTGTWHPPDAPI